MQYSLKTMMTAVLVAAVWCWMFFALPDPFAGIALIGFAVLAASATVALIVYGRGSARAFAIGCAPPVGVVFYWLCDLEVVVAVIEASGRDLFQFKIVFVVFLFVVSLSGLIGACTRQSSLARQSPAVRSSETVHRDGPLPETHAPAAERRM